MTDELEHMREWVGRREQSSDVVTPRLAAAYGATVFDGGVDYEDGGEVPPGLHWCLTTPSAPMGELGEDGHPKKGGFLPPIPAPRRMWAGSSVTFLDPLKVGDRIERVSEIASVDLKSGRTGRLWFVAAEHVYRTERGDAICERQDIVYRDEAKGPFSSDAEPPAEESRHDASLDIPATPPLLFRYSALTFNSHRIHYDLPFARDVEHYPGLVVHGPLQAALLLRLATQMRASAPKQFSFRGMKPLIAGASIPCRAAWDGTDAAALWTGVSRESPNLLARASW